MNSEEIVYIGDGYAGIEGVDSPVEMKDSKPTMSQVIWGWNRRFDLFQRTVFFQASLYKSAESFYIDPWTLYYYTCCPKEEAHYLFDNVNQYNNDVFKISLDDYENSYSSMTICGGTSIDANQHLIDRLVKKYPTRSLHKVSRNPNHFDALTSEYFPTILYAGSGLSYESSLPTLAEVHKWFGVDSEDDWTFGAKDDFPTFLLKDISGAFLNFCKIHILADVIPISKSYFHIKDLFNRKIIRDVLTDNIDDLFSRINVPHKRTRVTLFPDYYPVTFPEEVKSLLVVGVAADRRNIIEQVREKGLPVIVVNPYTEVAPYAQNLTYLQSNDIWLKMSAEEFFTRIVEKGEVI